MPFRLLADLTVLVHFLWIAFILLGLALAWRRSWAAWLHLATIVLVLILNLGGWYCPLTHLEVYLRRLHDPALAYPGSFLFTYLERLIYLPVPEVWLRWAGGGWAALNLAGHAWLLARGRRRRH